MMLGFIIVRWSAGRYALRALGALSFWLNVVAMVPSR